MEAQPEHELTLKLFEQVTEQLEGEEQQQLIADRRLIAELLALGPEPSEEQVATWVRNVDQH